VTPARCPDDEVLEVERLAPADPAVADAWLALQTRRGVESPFLTWEWFSALADVPEVCQAVRVVLVRRRSDPVGLLPLEWARGPGRLLTVGVAGWRWLAPDHLAVVGPPEHRGPAARAIVRHLRTVPDWDLLDLDGLDGDGALARAVAPVLRPPAFLPLQAQEVPAPYVDLRGKEEQGLLASPKLRQQIRQGLRVAERSGGGFSVVSDATLVPPLLEELMRLHNARFGAASSVFSTPARRRFHLLASSRLARAGMARIYRLVADGVDAALLYALVLEGRVYHYSTGIVPDAGLSPGRTVLGQAILSAATEGFEEFDMLRGDHASKQRFATGTRMDLRVRTLRVSPMTLAEALWRVARRAARRATRRQRAPAERGASAGTSGGAT
jgi:CelD/BcsL family acetyltransferase involved in cellulose biosynthesis